MRIQLTAILILMGLLTAEVVDADTIPKIFDGKPKIVSVPTHNSWGLTGCMTWALKACNINYIKVEGNPLMGTLINDTLGPLNPFNTSWDKISFPSDSPMIVFSDCGPGYQIDSPSDTAKINLGIRKIDKLTQMLKDRGADLVFTTTTHFAFGRFRDIYNNKGNITDSRGDRFVMQAYNNKYGRLRAVDILTPSFPEYYTYLEQDLEHPRTDLGRAIYGRAWIEAMYAHDGQQPPASLHTAYETARNKSLAQKALLQLSVLKPTRFDTLKWGDSVTIEVTVTDSNAVYQTNPPSQTPKYLRVIIMGFHGGKAGMYIAKDSVTATKRGTIAFVIPDSANVYYYGVGKKTPLYVDSARIQVFGTNGFAFNMSRAFILTDRNGKKFVWPRPVNVTANPNAGRRKDGSLTSLARDRGQPTVGLYDYQGRLVAHDIDFSVFDCNQIRGVRPGSYVITLVDRNGSHIASRRVAVR